MPDESKKQCFIISPIGADDSDIRRNADFFREDIVRKALGEEFDVRRADDYNRAGNITSQVIEAIAKADLIVADLTGRNPNVYYELGFSHTYQRHVVPTISVEDENPLPFDNYTERTIKYSLRNVPDRDASVTRLKQAVQETLQGPVSNPVTTALGLAKAAASGDDVQQLIANLVNQVATLGRKVEEHDRLWIREVAALTGSPITSNAIGAALLEPRAGIAPINLLAFERPTDFLTVRPKFSFNTDPPTGAINTLAQTPRPKPPDKK